MIVDALLFVWLTGALLGWGYLVAVGGGVDCREAVQINVKG